MTYYDAATVKAAARDRWVDLLARFGVDTERLCNRHGPCPGCGGKDRFRFDNTEGHGTFICSQGGGDLLSGDGFDLLSHVKNWEWKRSLDEIAKALEVEASKPPDTPRPQIARKVEPKPEFRNDKLSQLACRWRDYVDTAWLSDRSVLEPHRVHSAGFLSALYQQGEKIVVFDNDKNQGCALWPDEALPTRGSDGIWFLCQPVDGEFRPNPRHNNKPSRRSEESVTAWRYLVLESDKADARDWMGALVQLPLAIAAIYTSGRRSIHALIRVDAPSKHEWDSFARQLRPILVTLGADSKSLSAVRLTRLPGCHRAGRLQKLLYLNPAPDCEPICARPKLRDVLADLEQAAFRLRSPAAAEVVHRARARDLEGCISALESYEAMQVDRLGTVNDLTWFQSVPHARELLGRLLNASPLQSARFSP